MTIIKNILQLNNGDCEGTIRSSSQPAIAAVATLSDLTGPGIEPQTFFTAYDELNNQIFQRTSSAGVASSWISVAGTFPNESSPFTHVQGKIRKPDQIVVLGQFKVNSRTYPNLSCHTVTQFHTSSTPSGLSLFDRNSFYWRYFC